MIEIHAPHGYLEHSFLSPLTNKRTDLYGGEWRNRKRFLNEVAEQIRYACPGVTLGVRISNMEYVEGGLTSEEMIDVALDLQERAWTISAFHPAEAMRRPFCCAPMRITRNPSPKCPRISRRP